ncbi:hypothetical protein DRO49_06155, partial [Candidatus Bathyarchaeota archaeon]
EILKKLKAGEDFKKLASRYNIDGTKKTGGNLGWIKRGILVKPFEDVAFRLRKGEISGIVKTRFGYHIIKVEDIRQREEKRYEDIKGEIRKRLEKERIENMEKELRRKYGVKVNESTLKELN